MAKNKGFSKTFSEKMQDSPKVTPPQVIGEGTKGPLNNNLEPTKKPKSQLSTVTSGSKGFNIKAKQARAESYIARKATKPSSSVPKGKIGAGVVAAGVAGTAYKVATKPGSRTENKHPNVRGY